MTELPIVRTFTDSHGVEITFYEWPVASPRGVVQVAHGLGEHARRYDDFAARLNRAGFTVYADDHRGHVGPEFLAFLHHGDRFGGWLDDRRGVERGERGHRVGDRLPLGIAHLDAHLPRVADGGEQDRQQHEG